MEEIKQNGPTHGIKFKDKIGYALGDVGSLCVFGLVTSILQIYYTDALNIPPIWLVYMFLGARIWDAINDPIWGRIVDSRKWSEKGRYRPWIIKAAIPLAISAILMFVKIPGLNEIGYFIYACITYVAFGMMYTVVNIPYGSMASVITDDEKERSSLSVFRSVGSVIGAIPALLLLSLCYTNQKDADGNNILVNGIIQKQINYTILIIGVVIIAVLSVIAYVYCYKLSKERVVTSPSVRKEKGSTKKALKEIFKDRTLIVISLASMFFLAAQMFSQSYATYLMKYYFNSPELNILVMVCQYLPIAVIMFISGKLIRKFGKKEVCSAGILFCVVGYLILYLAQVIVGQENYVNVWIYLGLTFVAGIGSAFFFLQVWALATDAIDYHEVKTHSREDATSYAVFSFTRKLGQAAAAVLVNFALVWINYDTTTTANSSESLHQMYNLSAIIPAVLYGIMFLLLVFLYPLNKKKLVELQEQKAELNKEKE